MDRKIPVILCIFVVRVLSLEVMVAAPAFCADDRGQVSTADPGSDFDPESIWSELLQRTPYPYAIPLPEPKRTLLDGTYTKLDPKDTPAVHCRRCPDYAPEAGIWKLHLDRGVFRIFHRQSGWKSIASFVATRDDLTVMGSGRLLLANDPVCPDTLGLYSWILEEGRLILRVIEDTCAIRLRAKNLTDLPWLSCRPPNREAAVTDHRDKPDGCD